MKTHVLARTILLSGALLALAGALVVYLAVTRKPQVKAEPRPPVPRVVAPRIQPQRDHTIHVVGYGTARPRVRVDITPEVSGKIVKKAENFLPGKYVQAGQMLLEIEKTDYQQAADAASRQMELLDARLKHLAQEEANLAVVAKFERERVVLARRQHKRNVDMLKRGSATESEVDTAMEQMLARQEQLQSIRNSKALIGPAREQLRAERRIAEVAKAQAETALKRATVTSPVTGRVFSCDVEVGDRVQAGTPSGKIYGTAVMEVEVSIPASELRWLDQVALEAAKWDLNPTGPAGRIPATVSWREPGTHRVFAWDGYVERVRAGLEERTRTAAVVVQVRNDLKATAPALMPSIPLDVNMFCEVDIRGRTLPEVFLLPRRAIRQGGVVFLANGGRLSRQAVRVSRYSDEEALILPAGGGLQPGDRVVIGYVPKAVMGMRVEPIEPDGAPATRPAATAPGARE
ncbi:MAG: efflux RND transporter periplasmic adaptor subunit [Planctomycetota bacterium]|jgi:multidrug efflux pump subunit AcrA (membrane-fusion protein)